MLHQTPLMTLVARAEFEGTAWSLYASDGAVTNLESTTRHSHACIFPSTTQTLDTYKNHPAICCLCTHRIRFAHQQKGLDNWATTMQLWMPYLPYDTHFSLTMVRGSSCLHYWDISVPPSDEYIYAILHLHMICIYIFRTYLALIRLVREHVTRALTRAEDYTLHRLLHSTNLEDWYIVPLQLVWGKLHVAVAQRPWWDKYRQWAINNLPAAVPQDVEKPKKKVPHGAVQVLRSLSTKNRRP